MKKASFYNQNTYTCIENIPELTLTLAVVTPNHIKKAYHFDIVAEFSTHLIMSLKKSYVPYHMLYRRSSIVLK